MALWCCGGLLCFAGGQRARADEPGAEDYVKEAEQHLQKVSEHYEKVCQAEEAKLVSEAWSEGTRFEVEAAKLETELARLELKQVKGALSEKDYSVRAAEIQKKLARLEFERAKWRVAKLQQLAEAGMLAHRELEEAEAEFRVAQLREKLAEWETLKAHEKITPREYQDEYAKIIEQQAEIARQAAAAKLEHAKKMFRAGRATSLDVRWAEMELADAEQHKRSAAIEAQATVGDISWDQAEAKWALLRAEAAERRVQQLREILSDCEEAHKLGLVDEDTLRSCRKDLAQAKDDSKEAENETKKAKE